MLFFLNQSIHTNSQNIFDFIQQKTTKTITFNRKKKKKKENKKTKKKKKQKQRRGFTVNLY